MLLCERIYELYPNASITLVGDKGDAASLYRHRIVFPDKVTNLIGKTNLKEPCSIVAKSDLVLCHDSGVMHIADAYDRRLIALCGPTDLSRTGPLRGTSKVLVSKSCEAIMYDSGLRESDLATRFGEYQCLNEITVEQVIHELKNILRGAINT